MDNLAVDRWDEIEALYPPKSRDHSGTYSGGQDLPVLIGSTVRKLAPVPIEIPSPEERRRKELEEQRVHRNEILRKYKQKEHSVSKKRLRESLSVILAVTTIAGMFAVVLYRQAQIASLNFQNNAAQKRIAAICQETAQIRESMILATDLDMIRSEATERLGMQKPGTNQIINVRVAQGDTLITSNSYNTIEVSPAALAQAKEDLAKYYSNDS